jgi:hypothetical protein
MGLEHSPGFAPAVTIAHAGAGTVLAHWTGHYAVEINRRTFGEFHSPHTTLLIPFVRFSAELATVAIRPPKAPIPDPADNLRENIYQEVMSVVGFPVNVHAGEDALYPAVKGSRW